MTGSHLITLTAKMLLYCVAEHKKQFRFNSDRNKSSSESSSV